MTARSSYLLSSRDGHQLNPAPQAPSSQSTPTAEPAASPDSAAARRYINRPPLASQRTRLVGEDQSRIVANPIARRALRRQAPSTWCPSPCAYTANRCPLNPTTGNLVWPRSPNASLTNDNNTLLCSRRRATRPDTSTCPTPTYGEPGEIDNAANRAANMRFRGFPRGHDNAATWRCQARTPPAPTRLWQRATTEARQQRRAPAPPQRHSKTDAVVTLCMDHASITHQLCTPEPYFGPFCMHGCPTRRCACGREGVGGAICMHCSMHVVCMVRGRVIVVVVGTIRWDQWDQQDQGCL